ncbi:MAG: hypothetical protein A2147_07190 [Chloroflexi bacterium RBG_16_57_8]|nr:MAG: hypothetical protein A2147_07190 [Chloroflexi bacterium RBG_16_57_8]
MKKTWMPTTAAVLQLLASIPYLVISFQLFFSPRLLPENVGGTQVWAPIGFIVWLPFALPVLLGGISALIRRAWGMALIGALLPLALTFLLAPWQGTRIGMALFFFTSLPRPVCQAIEFLGYLFMVSAAVLIVWSRGEFLGRKSAAEHLFGPPKGWRGTDD